MPTVQEIHTIWPTARVLASNSISNGASFGAPTNANLAIQIELIGYAVDYQYTEIEQIQLGNTPSASLINTSNYLFAWCKQYGVEALQIYQAGGIIPTPTGNTVYGHPISGYYVAVTDGETVIDLSLPAGAIVIQVTKSILQLTSSQYSYVSPNLTLIGVSLSQDEQLFYLYVVPIT